MWKVCRKYVESNYVESILCRKYVKLIKTTTEAGAASKWHGSATLLETIGRYRAGIVDQSLDLNNYRYPITYIFMFFLA